MPLISDNSLLGYPAYLVSVKFTGDGGALDFWVIPARSSAVEITEQTDGTDSYTPDIEQTPLYIGTGYADLTSSLLSAIAAWAESASWPSPFTYDAIRITQVSGESVSDVTP